VLGTATACVGDTEGNHKTVSRIFNGLLATQTEDLPNRVVECCGYSKLFGLWFPLRQIN
jgi:hypothetical protein